MVNNFSPLLLELVGAMRYTHPIPSLYLTETEAPERKYLPKEHQTSQWRMSLGTPEAHPGSASHSPGFVLKGGVPLSDYDPQARETEGSVRTIPPSLSGHGHLACALVAF